MAPSTLYGRLSPKQRRTIDADVRTLFSVAGFMQNPSLEELRRADPWLPSVEHNGRAFFLSARGVSARQRLRESLSRGPELTSSCSYRELERQVAATHEHYFSKGVHPTSEEFVSHCSSTLLALVKDYQFFALLSGVELNDVPIVEMGTFRLQRSERRVFEQIRFEGNLDLDSVYQHFADSVWLVGSVEGGPDLAAERFRYRSALTVGLLGIYGAVLYRNAILRTHVQAMAPREPPRTITTLRCEANGRDPVLSMSSVDDQALPVTADAIAYVNEHCFFRELAALLDRKEPDDLQRAILTSVYWFGDAYQDRNPTMKFVKLWSCMESFFSIERDEVTDQNAKGIAAVLTYGGYNVTTPIAYPRLKAQLKKLYDLRSQAVHRGKIGHIGTDDLTTLSQWVAWVIISMTALSKRGYETLRHVQEQTARLDALHAVERTQPPPVR